MKTYIKKKSGPTLGYRTPDYFRGSKFSGGKGASSISIGRQVKFDPLRFRIQHKG